MRLWQTNSLHDITLTHGQDCTVWDASGKSYLDLLAGTWCNVLGYNHPGWKKAVQSQVDKLTHVNAQFKTEETENFLSGLRNILPPALNRIVLLNTGSEAVELALKIAHTATGADGVIVVEKGYYGATNYTLALSEVGHKASYIPLPGNIHRLPIPNCRRCSIKPSWPCEDIACLDSMRMLANAGESEFAAVIYEPVMVGGGVVIPPPGYGALLRELSSLNDVLLLAEEVTTGMGRTGRWFGYEHDGIVPDILVIGKALGAGLPVSAVVTTEEVETRCRGELRHIQSHQNDPFSSRIAATVISILQQERLVDQAAERSEYFFNALRRLQSRYPTLSDIRGRGLMIGIEIDQEGEVDGYTVFQRLLDAGFIVDYQRKLSTFRLFPPYILTQQEIDRFIEAFEFALQT